MTPLEPTIAQRLEYLRGELRAERISYGDLIELQSLAESIDPGDVELLEAAGVPEHPCGCGPIEGVLWPMATDKDSSHAWVESCDECQIYNSDAEAATALSMYLGCRVQYTIHPSLGRPAPYIDKPPAGFEPATRGSEDRRSVL